MGIEPTNRMFSIRLNGFEDRGPHQGNDHFRNWFGSTKSRAFQRWIATSVGPYSPANPARAILSPRDLGEETLPAMQMVA